MTNSSFELAAFLVPYFSFCQLILLVDRGFAHLAHVPGLKNIWFGKAIQFQGISFPSNSFSATCSSYLYFFGGEETRKGSRDEGMSYSEAPRRNSLRGRQWTNILIAINVLVFIGQAATQGSYFYGELRAVLEAGYIFLFACKYWHLMVNCFSLNSVGPTVENLSGPRRYLAVYFTSAIASSAMSYWLCKALQLVHLELFFGLVGSVAVFMMRHRGLVGDSKESLQHIARVIVLNMVIGCLSKGIDNWGHHPKVWVAMESPKAWPWKVPWWRADKNGIKEKEGEKKYIGAGGGKQLGGLLGGLVTSWLLGPAWKYESLSNDGRRVFADRAPIFHLVNRRRNLDTWNQTWFPDRALPHPLPPKFFYIEDSCLMYA
ncbi:RHOMBOID-like protein 10, chloroplastic [Vitis vinifera]|uniref:RHOMBOID-like protein 10, chloroplastic n=1 Tax=Vitis vinifera TaxID=29760 RepID=A0A438H5R4_VITVI|nr:RHOMBOID-like protein 10, chloroplastic [Vitis vinifera]